MVCLVCSCNNKRNEKASILTTIDTTEGCSKCYKDSLKVDIIENRTPRSYNELAACHFYLVDPKDNMLVYAKIMADEGDGFACMDMVEYYLSLDSTYFYNTLELKDVSKNFASLNEVKRKLVIRYLNTALSQEEFFSNRYYELLSEEFPMYFSDTTSTLKLK